MIKSCVGCSIELNEFNMYPCDIKKLYWICKTCRQKRNSVTKKKYPEKTRKLAIKYGRISQEWFKDLKEQQGCGICGYNKCGNALDYHHVIGNDKETRILGNLLHQGNKRILDEILKCILLCRNCHAELHFLYKDNNKL